MKNLLKKNNLKFYEIKQKPILANLQKYYAKKYFQKGLGSYEVNYGKAEKNWILEKNNLRAKIAEAYLPLFLKRRKTILDVGCGEGFGMQIFKKRGWMVKGLDFSSAGLAQQNPHLAKNVVLGDIAHNIQKIHKDRTQYSCILLINVLEHVLDPQGLLRRLKTVTRKKGIIIATVPNDFSTTQLLALNTGFIKRKFWVSLPEHLSYFNYESFKNIFRYNGWQELAIFSDFPVDWFLFHKGSNYIIKKCAGKGAHQAQIRIETEIFKKPLKDQLNFFGSLAKIGMGRNLTGVFQN